LNLDHTVAYTQNYVGSVNFPLAWKKTTTGRKRMGTLAVGVLVFSRLFLCLRALVCVCEREREREGEREAKRRVLISLSLPPQLEGGFKR